MPILESIWSAVLDSGALAITLMAIVLWLGVRFLRFWRTGR